MNDTIHRSVGRPREFDEQTVLAAAMDAFWRKGYEATSLTELCRCTGLNKGSLYQAFGDKHRLFMRSLAHYADMEYREVVAAASKSDSPLGRASQNTLPSLHAGLASSARSVTRSRPSPDEAHATGPRSTEPPSNPRFVVKPRMTS